MIGAGAGVYRAIVRNDVRLFWRRLRQRTALEFAGGALFLGILLLANVVAAALFSHAGRPASPGGQALIWMFLTLFMVAGSALNVLGLLAGTPDGALLLTSPAPLSAVLAARVTSLSLAAFQCVVLLANPLIDAAAAAFGLRFLWSYLTWAFLAVIAAAAGAALFGMGSRFLKPHRARTLIQAGGILLGIGAYLLSQTIIQSLNEPGHSALHRWENVAVVLGFGWAARMGSGDLRAAGALVPAAAVAFVLMLWLVRSPYLLDAQEPGAGAPASSGRLPRPWRGGLDVVAWRKEAKLIVRDPVGLMQAAGATVYYIPFLWLFFRRQGAGALPMIALGIAIVCSPVLTALRVNGEEGWDLLRMSPTAEVRLRRAKVAAGLTVPGAIALLLCAAAAAWGHVRAALIAWPLAMICGTGVCWIQACKVRPASRGALEGKALRHLSLPLSAVFVSGTAWTALLLASSLNMARELIGFALLILLATAMLLVIGLMEFKDYHFPGE